VIGVALGTVSPHVTRIDPTVRENPLTHFERNVFFAQVVRFDFGKRRAQFKQPILAASRGSHLLSGQSHNVTASCEIE
jgi:hypothetical protein